MNKKELVRNIAKEADVSIAVATTILNAFISEITKALVKKDDVLLVGFGTFKTKDRSARVGRNPKTGEIIQIPFARVPSFKAGIPLKNAVNDK